MAHVENGSRNKASALFASSQFLLGRVALSGMIGFAAWILGNRLWPLPWFGVLVASVYLQLIVGKVPPTFPNAAKIVAWSRSALSLLDAVMYAGAAAIVSQVDSSLSGGKVELEAAPFSLRAVVRGVHATFSAAASAKDIGFRLVMADEVAGVYRGDEARLRQVLYNLVSNAVKFTAVGEVCVTVSYSEPMLTVAVRDTGIGVPEDRKATLFEKFVQADASTTRRYGGTGLGLSIVHQLVEMMDGELSLESREGEGSTFTVEIPLPKLSAEDAGEAQSSEPAEADVALAESDLRVLVAEDNPTNQLVIKLMLAEAGVEPVIVGDGRAAVKAWEQQTWDIVLMDVQMPEMDGLAATRAIRARELETRRPRVPILALTANAMTHQRADYLAAGMDDLVSKPIDVNNLFQALDQALSTSADLAFETAA